MRAMQSENEGSGYYQCKKRCKIKAESPRVGEDEALERRGSGKPEILPSEIKLSINFRWLSHGT